MRKGSRPTGSRSFQALLGAIAACILALLAVGGFKSHRDLKRAHVRELAIESKIRETAAAVQQLENRIRALRDDPTSLERLAREHYNMVHPNDVVIVLPAKDTATSWRESNEDDQS